MKTATFIRDIGNPSTAPYQKLYRLSDPLESYEYVVVSAQDFSGIKFSVPSGLDYLFSSETYIFGASADGNIVAWTELEGSYRGGIDHELALRNAGYAVEIQGVIDGDFREVRYLTSDQREDK